MEYTSGDSSWRTVVRRATTLFRLKQPGNSPWRWGVPVIAVTAGLLFTTNATNALGHAPRSDDRAQRAEWIDGIDAEQARVASARAEAEALRVDVDGLTAQIAKLDGSGEVAANQARGDSYKQAAGLTAVQGPGVTVRLDDAKKPLDPDSADDAAQTPEIDPSVLIIHQQDVQSVVNALWAGGAEAITIMDVRIISTTAVKCVGNTLWLHGKHYSPEYRIKAIGDPEQLRAGLDASPGVQALTEAARKYKVGYTVTDEEKIEMAGFSGALELNRARVPE